MKTVCYKIAFLTSPAKPRLRIVPVFLPFAGCPFRCVFCAQDKQTGKGAQTFESALSELESRLQDQHKRQTRTQNEAGASGDGVEVAFYGGTFTCLPPSMQSRCLDITARWVDQGLVKAIRCSTRPDSVPAAALRFLASRGVELVELGVQSFDSGALLTSARGYDGKQAREGCMAVREAGLRLGIQLLPGMPGMPESKADFFLEDVTTALSLGAACMRFYPCLVVDGTTMADYWRAGTYAPWTLDTTVRTLAAGLLAAQKHNVPVIRLSLAPEPELEAAILDGPRHPALGNMIQAEALWLQLSSALQQIAEPFKSLSLRLPASCQGVFAGHKGSLLPRWKALGVQEVLFNMQELDTAEVWATLS